MWRNPFCPAMALSFSHFLKIDCDGIVICHCIFFQLRITLLFAYCFVSDYFGKLRRSIFVGADGVPASLCGESGGYFAANKWVRLAF